MVERLCVVVMKSAKGGNAAGNVTSAGWQVTLCDPIWHVSSRSSEACCELLYPVTLLTYLLTIPKFLQPTTKILYRSMMWTQAYRIDVYEM